MSKEHPLGLSRRDLVKAGSAASVLVATNLAAPFIRTAAAADSVKIGMVWAKTGPASEQGEFLAKGGYLALEERSNMLLGRPAEIIWLDEPHPAGAQQNTQRLIDEHKVVALTGGAFSATALAISAVVKRAQIPFVASNAAAADLTGKLCNPYTFRLQPAVDIQAKSLAPYALNLGKKWYLITPDYAFGQDVHNAFNSYNQANGGTVVGADAVPTATSDYSSYILKIRQARPDVVISGLAGADMIAFFKQWAELGMKGRIPVCQMSPGDTEIWGLGPQVATGIHSKTWYFNNPANSEDDKKFAASFLKKHGQPAPDKAWMGYFGMRTLLTAIETAKSTEPKAIARGLLDWHQNDGDLRMRYRDFDHQMIRRTLICEVKPTITDKWDMLDVKAALPGPAAEVEAAFGSASDSACKMDPA